MLLRRVWIVVVNAGERIVSAIMVADMAKQRRMAMRGRISCLNELIGGFYELV
jgi:hypothetical protein